MGQTEIEDLLKDGKERTEKEISEKLNIRIININRSLKQMLKSHDVLVIKRVVLI
jgi:predicted transcriptional regulator